MGTDETPGERIVRLETQILSLKDELKALKEQNAARSAREWTMIASALGLLGTIVGKTIGLIP